jgi:hypothetical protein
LSPRGLGTLQFSLLYYSGKTERILSYKRYLRLGGK